MIRGPDGTCCAWESALVCRSIVAAVMSALRPSKGRDASPMRDVIEAGTDAASLLLFDPGALPPDFEDRLRAGSVEVLARLDDQGKVCWISTEGDGRFLLHAYVDEPVPAALRPYLRDPVVVERFPVPTGRLFLTGSEYAFRDDDQFLRQHPHMGGFCTIRPGAYRLTLYRGVYPVRLARASISRRILTLGVRPLEQPARADSAVRGGVDRPGGDLLHSIASSLAQPAGTVSDVDLRAAVPGAAHRDLPSGEGTLREPGARVPVVRR